MASDEGEGPVMRGGASDDGGASDEGERPVMRGRG